MEQKELASGKTPSNSHTKKKSMFIKPFKKILVDIEIFAAINLAVVYGLLFLTRDTTVAMLGVAWVSIIAWRGGLYAGLIGSFCIYFSSAIAMSIPPHQTIEMTYYFDNRIPGFVIGVGQCVVAGTVVGYISNLVHQLREEIQLRQKIQKELEQNIEQLDAFGRTVAHDLKNPLMVINMSIEALMMDFEDSNDEKIKRKMLFINNGTKNMANIIESILLLAGIKKIDPSQFKEFPVEKCINDALSRLEYTIHSAGATVVNKVGWPSVVGYAPWITEVWVNYISNAIKYGGNPSKQIKPVVELGFDKLAVSTVSNGEQFRFWVKDNGEGIASEQVATLFKEFSRLHKNDKEGHGLGLSIAKSIIQKSGGEVGVQSSENGSLFYFTLPSSMDRFLSN